MGLPKIRGHAEARAHLARATVAGTLPQSILLHGAAGIGKERLGLWLGQLLLCESPTEEAPCGACLSCRLAQRLEHPDLHWFFPLPRPDASSQEKLRDRLEEARAAELQERRASPLHLPTYERPPAYFLATIQALQQVASVRPSVGRRKVVVVGDAELMVPQESSQEAANAFLKLLEEPPPYLTLVLTASQPGALLPTIRSRVLPYRLLPLVQDEVLDFLVGEGGIEETEARGTAAAARGSIGRALRMIPAGDAPGPLTRQRSVGRQLLIAALAEGPVQRLSMAHEQAPAGARGEFVNQLDALSLWLRDLLAVASGGEVPAYDESMKLLKRAAALPGLHPLGVAEALEEVTRARGLAYGNVNPQLIMAGLLHHIQRSLRGSGTREQRGDG